MIKPLALIVDDSLTALNMQGTMVEGLGFEVYHAKSGEEAMKLLMSEGKYFDLIVIDYLMGEMDGLAFGEILKHSKAHEHTTIVMLSSESDAGLVQRCKDIGFAGCFNKKGYQGGAFKKFIEDTYEGYVNTIRPMALVVDDSPTALSLISALVRLSGFGVKMVDNAVEAMRLVSDDAEHFDILVIDYGMEVMNGLEFGMWVRGREGYGSVPMYMITAALDAMLEFKAKQSGFQGCFHKDHDLYKQFNEKLGIVYNRIMDDSVGRSENIDAA